MEEGGINLDGEEKKELFKENTRVIVLYRLSNGLYTYRRQISIIIYKTRKTVTRPVLIIEKIIFSCGSQLLPCSSHEKKFSLDKKE